MHPVLSEDKQTYILNTAFWEPISTSQQDGFFDLLMKEAFVRAGKKVVIRRPPAERGLINASSGIDDGDGPRIANIQNMDIYTNLVRVPEKIIDVDFIAFSKNPNYKIRTWSDLRKYNVGIVTGWKILEWNIKEYKSLIKVKNPNLLFSLFLSQRVDVVVIDKWTGKNMIDKLDLDGIHIHDEYPLATREMYLFMNKAHMNTSAEISNILKEMKKDGTYSLIVNNTLKK
tara:strand:+ start:7917 stop:8603 length:687 start_codon:yes stop_codon:yes gene_type:complete